MKLMKFSGNPVLKPNPEVEWESLIVCNPGVWYENDTFLCYTGRPGTMWSMLFVSVWR